MKSFKTHLILNTENLELLEKLGFDKELIIQRLNYIKNKYSNKETDKFEIGLDLQYYRNRNLIFPDDIRPIVSDNHHLTQEQMKSLAEEIDETDRLIDGDDCKEWERKTELVVYLYFSQILFYKKDGRYVLMDAKLLPGQLFEVKDRISIKITGDRAKRIIETYDKKLQETKVLCDDLYLKVKRLKKVSLLKLLNIWKKLV